MLRIWNPNKLTSRILSVIVWMIGQDEFRAEAFRNRAAKCSLDEYIRSVLGMVDEEGRRDRLVRCSTTSAHVTGHLQERRGVGILPVEGHHLP